MINGQSYSYGGTTSTGHNAEGLENMKPNRERVIKVRFNADTSSSLTWDFKPQQTEIKVSHAHVFTLSYWCS